MDQRKTRWQTLLLVVMLLTASIGCSLSAAQQEAAQSGARSQPTTVTRTTVAPSRGTNTPVATTQTPAPLPATFTPTSPPTSLSLIVGKSGVGQSGHGVSAVFLVQNPNHDYALLDIRYRLTVLDTAGKTLASSEGTIDLVMPDDELPIDTHFIVPCQKLPCDLVATRVDVVIEPGRAVKVDLPQQMFTVDRTKFMAFADFSGTNMAGDFFQVTGIFQSHLEQDARDVIVEAVGYDKDGQIVGGGSGKITVLPAGGSAPVAITVITQPSQIRWSLNARIPGLDSLTEKCPIPPALEIVRQGYGRNQQGTGVAFLVKNSDSALPIQNATFQVTAYDKAGTILSTNSGKLDVIFPDDTAAGYTDLFVPVDMEIANVEIQLTEGQLLPFDLERNPLTTSSAVYVPDDLFPKVSAIVSNALDRELGYLDTVAVVYNQEGNIIGGGSMYIQSIPASEVAPAKVSVLVMGTPARVELYAGISNISTVGE